jgi:hypothetical protein
VIERFCASNLELGVLLPAQGDPPVALDLGRRDEPASSIADKNEQEIDPRRIEGLDQARPALVHPRCGQLDRVVAASVTDASRRLHLNSEQVAVEVGD